MHVFYRFKLQPNAEQLDTLDEWQHKVGYIQNRSIGDRTITYTKTFVMGDYCDLFTRREVSQNVLYCDFETKALVSPLHCSVNKSASLGYPWKEDIPSRRRGKNKEKSFNPRRSAYEMHSAWVTEFKKSNPEYQTVSSDVFQQSLRHIDSAFSKFLSGKAGYPNFKQHKNVGIEFKPGTISIENNYITFPILGTMRFFKSREIPESWEVRTVTIICDVDGW